MLPPASIEHEESPQDLNKMTVFKLLKGFKLQQYANKMSELGFKSDIYKLTFLSHRERDELMQSIHMLPGHRDRMNELFSIIESLNPKNTLKKALINAAKQSSKIKPGLPSSESKGKSTSHERQQYPENIYSKESLGSRPSIGAKSSSVQRKSPSQPSKISNNSAQSNPHGNL